MDTTKSLPFFPFMVAALILILIGWGGLAYLVLYTLPTLGPRWLFFFFTTLAASGLALPFAYLLNRRFPSTPPVEANVIVRQAVWVGVYADLLVWLQLGNTLSIALVFFLAVGLAAIEFLIRLRERTRFQPDDEESDE